MLRNKLRRESINKNNRYKRLTKWIYMVFRKKEPQIFINESWQTKYFKKLTQVQTEELNNIQILIKFEDSLRKDL